MYSAINTIVHVKKFLVGDPHVVREVYNIFLKDVTGAHPIFTLSSESSVSRSRVYWVVMYDVSTELCYITFDVRFLR